MRVVRSTEEQQRSPGAQDSHAEQPRGHAAATPSDIPARGWKDVLWRVYGNVGDHRILLVAAGMTFYTLLAIFPALAALVALYGLFADPSAIAGYLDQLSGVLPGGAMDVVRSQLTRLASQGTQSLGFAFGFGLAVSLWSANAAMKSLFDALNIVYREEEKRGFIKLNLITLSFTLGAIIFILLAIGAVVVLPVLLQYVGFSDLVASLLSIGRWPAMLIVLTTALAFVFRYGPSRDDARWRWITWGSALAAILWLAASGLFSWYAANFGSFNKTYGSLGAVIGFMTWIWISGIVILMGAELDAEMEHQTRRDTTTGPREERGRRGARVADTVAR